MILLNPGPTNTLEEVKQAQWQGSDVCHRTQAFLDLLSVTKKQLLTCFSAKAALEDWHVAIIGGSGTLALEAMISSLLGGQSLTVLNSGDYGKRALDIFSLYNIPNNELVCKDPSELTVNPSVKSLYFVQHETSTGEDFSLDNICLNYPHASLYLDATSAFGAIDYTPYLKKINAISFCSNKCLQSTPGLGMIIWRKSLTSYRRNYYMDLARYTVLDDLPFTLPTQALFALNKALSLRPDSLTQELIFRERQQRLIKDLSKLGIKCINDKPSNVVIGFQHPTKDFCSLNKIFLEKGIVIYSAIKHIKNSFRISTISVLFDDNYLKILHVFALSI